MNTPTGDGKYVDPTGGTGSQRHGTHDGPSAAPITTPDSNDHSAPDPDAVDHRAPSGKSPDGVAHTRAAALWTGLIVGAIVLVLLLVFILQNLDSVPVDLFVWTFDLPLGVAMLLAAIAGALVMALAGGVRILQIRRAAKRK